MLSFVARLVIRLLSTSTFLAYIIQYCVLLRSSIFFYTCRIWRQYIPKSSCVYPIRTDTDEFPQ